MNQKATTSIVYKPPYPEMYIPEQLRSGVTIKQFWYQKMISLIVALWWLATKPFRKEAEEPQPGEKTTLEEKVEVSEEGDK